MQYNLINLDYIIKELSQSTPGRHGTAIRDIVKDIKLFAGGRIEERKKLTVARSFHLERDGVKNQLGKTQTKHFAKFQLSWHCWKIC